MLQFPELIYKLEYLEKNLLVYIKWFWQRWIPIKYTTKLCLQSISQIRYIFYVRFSNHKMLDISNFYNRRPTTLTYIHIYFRMGKIGFTAEFAAKEKENAWLLIYLHTLCTYVRLYGDECSEYIEVFQFASWEFFRSFEYGWISPGSSMSFSSRFRHRDARYKGVRSDYSNNSVLTGILSIATRIDLFSSTS